MSSLAVSQSPSLAKIKSLADSINQMSVTSRAEAEANSRAMEQRISGLEEKLKKTAQSDSSKFLLLGDQLTKLSQAFAAEKASRELMEKRKSKEIELVQAGL